MGKIVVLIRPEPGLSETSAKARAMGFEVAAHPLFEIEPVDWMLSDTPGFDGLLIGSANALRHGGAQLEKLRHLPVYAVGQTTARIAEREGFTIAKIGEGGLQSLLNSLSREKLRLLRLAGEDNVDLQPLPNQEICEKNVYRAKALDMSKSLLDTLDEGAVVALHSAAAAKHFISECRRLGAERRHIHLAALGPRIGEAASDGWARIDVAAQPNDAALLALIADICQ